MDTSKYDRSVSLFCPTCGNDQFEYGQEGNEGPEVVTCASCGHELTKDQLLQENSENITAHVDEVGKEFVEDVANDLRATLKRAFRNSKNIKIR